MNVVLLGATSGMGRAIARLLAERHDRLFLLGRDPDDVRRSATDLEVRGAGPVGVAACDLLDPDGFSAALDAAWAELGKVDAIVVTAALFATQDALEADRALARRLVTANYANTVVFCEEARVRLLAQGGGTLCVFSSVAGDRGRKPVGLYGSAKAGLSHYLESLDHKYRAQGLVTVCVKPGFVKTSMTDGLKPPPFAGEPDAVARAVVRAIDRGTPLVYAPGIWRLVMLAIRHLPRTIMRRISF
jgi:NAD(P)-dependent dehydrogenase (short-subunit alcohol dehydrogenase family)